MKMTIPTSIDLSKELAEAKDILPNPIVLTTGGDGLWSKKKKNVSITAIKLNYYEDTNEGETFYLGHLKVYFDTKTWNIKNDGLIYTDNLWLEQLNTYLEQKGLPEIDYSEQGMQGKNYVDLDVDDDFISIWLQTY
jgi:hypothetical protein